MNPSFNQLITGRGSPVALHFSNAVPSTASVWLAGPCRIMGGGLSVKTKGQRNFQNILTAIKFSSLDIESKVKAPKSILLITYSVSIKYLSSVHTILRPYYYL